MKKKLQLSLHDFNAAYAYILHPVFIVDASHTQIYLVTHGAEKICGYKKLALQEMQLISLFTLEDQKSFKETLEAGKELKNYAVFNLKMVRKSGRFVIVHVFGKGLMINEIEMIIFTIQDVTDIQKSYSELEKQVKIRTEDLYVSNELLKYEIKERKQAEQVIFEQREQLIVNSKLCALGELAGGIAHEMNNPLAIVGLSAESLKEALIELPGNTSVMIPLVDKILTMSNRMSSIVKNLLSFAQERSHDDPFEEVLVQSLITSVCDLCQQRFYSHEIAFKIGEVEKDLRIECRPNEITQVLLSLLNNAYDAIVDLSHRWVKIQVHALPSEIEIKITDSGSGISKEIRNQIFDPFFTTKAVGRGSGLGLSLSKGMIEGHQGTLELDNHCSHTCFVIRLPQKQMTMHHRMKSIQ